MIQLSWVLLLSGLLFIIGVIGVIVRKNIILILMSLELMFNAANLAFIAFARLHQNIDGQIIVFFIMAVSAAEVAIGLAITIMIFRNHKSINIDDYKDLKG
jgi:NADH-quinone oxidoreductase subunit K